MTAVADLSNSFRGWGDIIVGRPNGEKQFRLTNAGLLAALLTFALALLLSVAAQSAALGMPGLGQVVLGLLIQSATVALLGMAISRTLKFLGLGVPLLALLVPALYGLAYIEVLAIPLTLIGPNAGILALAVLGFMLYRLARMVGLMPLGVAIAFAVLCVLVLVAVPNALYMLVSLIPSAP